MLRKIICLSLCAFISSGVFSQESEKENSGSLRQFVKDMKADYRLSSSQTEIFMAADTSFADSVFLKKMKRESYRLVTKWLAEQIRNGLVAPFCYTLWWWNRTKITQKVYDKMLPLIGSTDSLSVDKVFEWLNRQIEGGTYKEICEKDLKAIGKFRYFIWTFSDIEEPLGRGGLPHDYKSGRNTFCNRFAYSAIRNPGGLRMHIYQRSGAIKSQVTTFDSRQEEEAVSYGIGNVKLGRWLSWYVDVDNKLYFIYERATKKKIFYCGFVRTFSKDEFGIDREQDRKRFEISLRKNKSADNK
jgi:hypothetical protein